MILLQLFLSATLYPTLSLAAPDLSWRAGLQSDVTFLTLLDDALLVGTERHLYAVEMHGGGVRWRLRNVSVREDQTLPVPGTDVLLVNEGWGGKFQDKQSSLLAVDVRTGTILWESKTIRRQILTVVPDSDRQTVLLVTAEQPHKDDNELKRRLRLHLLRYEDGYQLWTTRIDKKIELTPLAEWPGQDKRSFDLSGYHTPVFYGDRLFVLYDRLRCFAVATGKQSWQTDIPLVEEDLAKSYAEPLFDGVNLYLAGQGRLWAVDFRSGRRLWKSSDFGVVTEIYFEGDRLYGKLGGSFFDAADQRWNQFGPYGAVALDRRTGKKLWKWDNGKKGITNLVIFGDRVYMADAGRLIALDRYQGKKIYAKSHDFKKPPRYLGLSESNALVVGGEEDVAAFAYGDGKRLWKHYLEPPGGGFWRGFIAGIVRSTGVLLSVASFTAAVHQGLLPAVPAPLNRFFGFRGRVRRVTREVGFALLARSGEVNRRSRYAQLDGNHHYFFSKYQGKKQLVGVNLSNGKIDQLLQFDYKQGRLLTVSESRSRIFQAQGSRVQAFDLKRIRSAPVITPQY